MRSHARGYALPLLKHVLLLSVLLLSVTGYARSKKSIKKEMDQAYGHTLQELIINYGPVAVLDTDGAGGSIAIFTRTISNQGATVYNPNGTVWMNVNPSQYYIHRMFFLDKEGKVYHWMYESNKIPPQQLNLNVNGSLNLYHYK